MKAINQVDYKTKYKAFHEYELYNDSFEKKLYQLFNKNYTERRFVVSVNNAFDVLTLIHLKLGYFGKDKCFYSVD